MSVATQGFSGNLRSDMLILTVMLQQVIDQRTVTSIRFTATILTTGMFEQER